VSNITFLRLGDLAKINFTNSNSGLKFLKKSISSTFICSNQTSEYSSNTADTFSFSLFQSVSIYSNSIVSLNFLQVRAAFGQNSKKRQSIAVNKTHLFYTNVFEVD
ncbi:hypothetical protein M8C21_005299, partial [Ambrosia artemisiifolia]